MEIDPEELGAETEALANEVRSLRSQLDEIRNAVAFRDQVAEHSFTPQPEPIYSEPVTEFVATEPMRVSPPRVSAQRTAAVTRQALSVVADTNSEWSRVSGSVMAQIKEDPSRLGALASTGNPLAVAGYLQAPAGQEQSRVDSRAMKIGAQSMVGASGRTPALPDDVQAWETIKAATPKRYFD